MTDLQNFLNGIGLGISKQRLAEKAYFEMKRLGHDVYLINDIYISIDGKDYQFIKSRKNDMWIVKDF